MHGNLIRSTGLVRRVRDFDGEELGMRGPPSWKIPISHFDELRSQRVNDGGSGGKKCLDAFRAKILLLNAHQ